MFEKGKETGEVVTPEEPKKKKVIKKTVSKKKNLWWIYIGNVFQNVMSIL